MTEMTMYFLAGIPVGYFAHWLHAVITKPNGKVMHFGKSKAQSMIPEEERRIVIAGRGGWEAGGVCEHEYMRGTRPARQPRRMPNGTME